MKPQEFDFGKKFRRQQQKKFSFGVLERVVLQEYPKDRRLLYFHKWHLLERGLREAVVRQA